MRKLDPNDSYSSDFVFSAKFRNGSEAVSGCYPRRAEIALRAGPSWTSPSVRVLFSTLANGDLLLADGSTIPSTLNAWHDFVVRQTRLDTTTVRLDYQIDGLVIPTMLVSAATAEEQVRWLSFATQEGSAWFDDVTVEAGRP